jgi:hypothetical protein
MSLIRTKIETLKPGSEYIATVRLRNTDLNVLSEYSDTIRFKVPSDTTIPGKLQNLKIYANYMTVMFVFDPSNEKDAAEYEYELYNFDEVQQVGSTLGVIEGKFPSLSGRNKANVFTISLNEDFSTDQPNSYIEYDSSNNESEITIFWYGRVRTIDTSGNIGPWSDIARSDDTPLIEDQFVKNLTASKITAGTIGAHTITLAGTNSIIQSSNYSQNVSGWIIKGNGFAEFDSTVIRGGLKAGSVFIDANNRWNADTSGNVLGNNYFKVGSSTKYVEWDPNLSGGTLKISGELVGATGTFSGSLSAATGTFSGSLSAATGTFSGTITASTITGGDINGTNVTGTRFRTRTSVGNPQRIEIIPNEDSVTTENDSIRFFSLSNETNANTPSIRSTDGVLLISGSGARTGGGRIQFGTIGAGVIVSGGGYVQASGTAPNISFIEDRGYFRNISFGSVKPTDRSVGDIHFSL